MGADSLVEQFLLYRKLANRMPALAEAVGYPHIAAGSIQILYAVKDGEKPVQEVADILGITQQAVGKMVREAMKSSVVSLRVNEGDRRSRIISITDMGSSVWSTFEDLCESNIQVQEE